MRIAEVTFEHAIVALSADEVNSIWAYLGGRSALPRDDPLLRAMEALMIEMTNADAAREEPNREDSD